MCTTERVNKEEAYLIRGSTILHSLEHTTVVGLHVLVFEQFCHQVGILHSTITGEVCCCTLQHTVYMMYTEYTPTICHVML